MKKTIPFMISVLAITSIASTAVLGNTQTAFAGIPCTIDPNMVDAGFLPVGDRFVVIKTVTCSDDVTAVEIVDASDCVANGISVRLGDFGINQGEWNGEEVIDNIAADIGKTTCTVSFEVNFNESTETLTQTIMVTTQEPVVPVCGDMYGSGANKGVNLGSIFLVSQTDGSQTFLGDPTTDGGVSGIAFDNQFRLWGSNVVGGTGDSNLLEINPSDGSLINDVGPIHLPGDEDIQITDLAYDPISNQLFGATRSDGDLVTIDRTTAAATLIGSLPNDPAHIGFAPDGTLYMVDRSFGGDLFTIDPENANVLTQVLRNPEGELDALGVSPAGVIWVSRTTNDALGPEVGTIDTAGNRVVIGSGLIEVADLDFLPCPIVTPQPPVGGEIIPIESTSLILASAQSFSWMIPVVLSVLGIGLFVVSRKSENS